MSDQCQDILRCNPNELRQAMAIHTRKVTDSCRDKDCIEDLPVYLTAGSQRILDSSAGTRVRCAELLSTYIDVEPVAFDRNHYCIDITFYYRIIADTIIGANRPATLYGLSVLGVVSFPCAMYFLAGVAIRSTRCPFTTLFRATGWAVLPLALLCLHPEHFDRSSIGGVMIVGLVISLLLWLFPFVKGKLRRGMLFLGRNTLPLYIFSPLFTICCKALVPLFGFDPTRLLFLVVSLAVCTAGSLLVCRACDMLRLSPLLFGRKSLLT